MDAVTTWSVPLRADLREALEDLKKIGEICADRSECYPVDRRDAYKYFGVLPKWRKKIIAYLQELRAKDERVTYVDICGRATAESLGANENYSFSLQPLGRYDWNRPQLDSGEDPRVCGDIFSTRAFNMFLDLIRRNGSRPAFVTFEPVAGLQIYTPSKGNERRSFPRLNGEIRYQILERHLRRVVAILRPEGYILLGPPFQFMDIGDLIPRKPQSEYQSSLRVKELCKKLKCSVEVGETINGPRWLIRKWKSNKK